MSVEEEPTIPAKLVVKPIEELTNYELEQYLSQSAMKNDCPYSAADLTLERTKRGI